jgi:branched-chain amino acid transport system permease protein
MIQALVQQLIIGLSIGATYALIALGYTMVYGVLRLINFAHGEVYMVGGVSAYFLAVNLMKVQAPTWVKLGVVLLGAMCICGALGFLIETLAYRPLRYRPRLVVLITAIGVSLLLQNLAQLPWVFGATPRSLPRLIETRTVLSFHLGQTSSPISITNLDLISLGTSLIVMLLLLWIVMCTRTGLALRAVSHRVDTAALMGINTNRIISFTFILGSALAAVAGVVDAIRYDVRPLMGLMPGLKAFIAAVLGGIGSIPGALLGGLLLGTIETMAKAYLPPDFKGYADGVAFLVLILILIVKPSGLLGRPSAEKV